MTGRWQRAEPLAVALCIAAAGFVVAPHATASPNASCLTCHNRIAFDPAAFRDSVHGELACSDCHRGFSGDPHGQQTVPPPDEAWLQAVLVAESHTQTGAWGACGGDCHGDVIEAMASSRHIRPMVETGSADGAFCADCHGDPHSMAPSPTEPAERLAFVEQSCVPCHEDAALVDRYALNPDVVFSYQGSLHGRAARLGSERAPSCVDCHEAHAVRGGDQPGSPLAPDQRAAVCRQCHEGANDNFASIPAHRRISKAETPLEYWVTVFFVGLTISVILLLVLHILLDIMASFRRALARH